MIYKFFLGHLFVFYSVVFIVFGLAGAQQKGKNNSVCLSPGSNSKLSKRFECAQLPPMYKLPILANPDYFNLIKDGAFLGDYLPDCKTIGTNNPTMPSSLSWSSGKTSLRSGQTTPKIETQKTSTTITTVTTTQKPSIKIPYAEKFKGEMRADGNMIVKREMREGGHITIKGEINENPEFLDISLLYNAMEWHEFLGATVLNIHVDFQKDTIAFSSYFSGKWIYSNGSDTIPERNPFNSKESFECRIEAQNDYFNIMVNEKEVGKWTHRMPVWTVNWLRVDGNVTILEIPEIFVPEAIKRGTNYSVELPSLLRAGDSLEFSGFVPKNASFFAFYLLHEAPVFDNEIGDTIVRLQFNYTEYEDGSKKAFAEYFEHKTGLFDKITMTSNDLLSAMNFYVAINVTENKFELNRFVEKQKKFYPFLPFDQFLPAWGVDHIWIIGDVDIHSDFPKLIRPKESMQIKHLEKPLETRDVIKIQGTLIDTNIRISLFSGALGFNKEVGKTVLEINLLGNGKVTFRSFFNGKYANENGFPEMFDMNGVPQVGQKLAFDIEVESDCYKIIISSSEMDPIFKYSHQYDHILPIWAVDYVVVEGGLDVENLVIEKKH